MLKLIKLTKEYYNQLNNMLDEWINDINLNHTDTSPYTIFRNDYHDFDNYLNNLEQKEEKDGRVPDSVFFLLDTNTNNLLGAVNIRHKLSDYLYNYGGHIGDGIRPSERNKGYGTILVKLALEECKKLNITKVLMTCDKSNVASAKTIIKNNGILENEIINPDGIIMQRYWINLE